MRLPSCSAICAALSLVVAGAHAGPVISNVNAFVFSDFRSSNSGSEGALVVGGNATLANYSVNSQRGSAQGLVSGGNVSLTSGQVNGAISAEGTVAIKSGSATGGVQQLTADEFAFDGYRAHFEDLSARYGGLVDTGSVIRQSWGGLQFTSESDASIAVFTLTGTQLLGANSLTFTGLDRGQQLVLNIVGDAVQLSNIDLSSTLGSYSTILNFVDATDVEFTNTSVRASILAPEATIRGRNGNLAGLVVAYGWDSSLALRDDAGAALSWPLDVGAEPPPGGSVPEPGGLALVGVACIALAMAGRLRKRENG